MVPLHENVTVPPAATAAFSPASVHAETTEGCAVAAPAVVEATPAPVNPPTRINAAPTVALRPPSLHIRPPSGRPGEAYRHPIRITGSRVQTRPQVLKRNSTT